MKGAKHDGAEGDFTSEHIITSVSGEAPDDVGWDESVKEGTVLIGSELGGLNRRG